REIIRAIVERALAEDVGSGDLTTLALIPRDAQAEARVIAREAGVVAGLPVLAAVFEAVDPSLVVGPRATDCDHLAGGAVLAGGRRCWRGSAPRQGRRRPAGAGRGRGRHDRAGARSRGGRRRPDSARQYGAGSAARGGERDRWAGPARGVGRGHAGDDSRGGR